MASLSSTDSSKEELVTRPHICDGDLRASRQLTFGTGRLYPFCDLRRSAVDCMDALRQCLGTNSITRGFSKAIRLSNTARSSRNLANKMQHPARGHALAARTCDDVFAQIHGSIDGGVNTINELSLALERQAGRDDVVADWSKGRAGHAVEGRVLRSKLAQVDASVGDRIGLVNALAEHSLVSCALALEVRPDGC